MQEGFEVNAACFSIIVEAMARAGELRRSFKWLQMMQEEGVALTSNGLLFLVDGLCRDGRTEKAEYWVREMHRLGSPIDSVTSSIIGAHAARGDLEKAEAWFKEMSKCQGKFSSYCYNGLINACAQAGDVARAE